MTTLPYNWVSSKMSTLPYNWVSSKMPTLPYNWVSSKMSTLPYNWVSSKMPTLPYNWVSSVVIKNDLLLNFIHKAFNLRCTMHTRYEENCDKDGVLL
jgi:hypothetical protein